MIEQLEYRQLLSAELTEQGQLQITGTPGDDVIRVVRRRERIVVRGGESYAAEFSAVDVKSMLVKGRAGDDRIVTRGVDLLTLVWCGKGDDTVISGGGDDYLQGDDGDDVLRGNGGDDFLTAGEGRDVMVGGDGDDTLSHAERGEELHGGPGRDKVIWLKKNPMPLAAMRMIPVG